MDLDEHRVLLHIVKDMGLNLTMLSLESLHVLHQGVANELKIT